MFKIKNHKGFTMVELLAAVTILGILATIAIVSVTNTMEKSHKEYDKKQNKLFTTAAQTYFTDNRSELPKKLLTTNTVTLKKLIEENYIEEIVDYKKKAYDKTKSVATVKKTGAGKYMYYSTLVSGDGKRVISDDPENKKTSNNITAKILGYDASESSRTTTIDNVYYINNKLKINISLSGGGDGISSYQYKIEKLSTINSSTGKKYKTSGEIVVDNTSFNDTITINAKDFANGIYRLHVYAYSYEGTTSISTESKVFVIDKTKPKCTIEMSREPDGNKVEGDTFGNKWYKAGDLSAIMKITEKNKYKYTLGFDEMQYNIEYIYNNTKEEEKLPITQNIINKYVYGYLQDKAGNVGECKTEKPIYYDNTVPTCKINISGGNYHSDTGWYWDDISLSLARYDDNGKNQSEQGDNESGVYQYDISTNNFKADQITTYTNSSNKTQTNETKGIIWYGYLQDKAGNQGKCQTDTLKLEKTEPTCQINFDKSTSKLNGSDTEWFNQNVNATVGYETKTISGIKYTYIKYTNWPTSSDPNSILLTNGTNNWVYGNLIDNAGKSTTCLKYAKVDTQKPECKIEKNRCDPNGNVYTQNGTTYCGTFGYQYKVSCSDEGGSNCYYLYYLKTTGATSANNKFRNDFPDIYAHGYSTAQYTVYDNAGNSRNCQTANIHIDTHGPNIYYDVNGHSGFGYNGSHNKMPRKIYCKDDDIRVDKSSFTGDFERNGEFIEGEGAGERENRRWYVSGTSDKKVAMSYHYLTNGEKQTKFSCEDALGNKTEQYIDNDKIYCRCRASKNFGCTTKDGKTTCKYKTGDIVYSASDTCKKNGETVKCNCGNQHTKNGVTFNSGKSDGSGTDMYLSCAAS